MTSVLCVDISGITDAEYLKLYRQASAQRKQRADQYRRKPDAVRCLTGESLVRFALGTDCFTVMQTPSGKPYIRERTDFHYNLSHSGRWVVLAFGDRELGVDVERIRPETNIEAISSRFFSEQEQQYIREDSGQSRSRFFAVWTAKESYLKYLGTGLKTDLTSFSVLNLDPALRLHQRMLDEAYFLSLCVADDSYTLQLLNIRQLL